MRLTAILTLVFTLNLSAKTFSQSITIKGKHLPLYDVFNSISRQTGYEFVYDEKMLQKVAPVNLDMNKASLTEVLNACLSNKLFTYSIVDKTIVVSPRPKATETAAAAGPITGKITGDNGEPLVGVSIQVKGTSKGTATDIQGSFSLQANPGDVLVVTYVGFAQQQITVGNNTTINIRMAPQDSQLSGVVVTALGIRRQEKSITYSTQQVNGLELTKAKDPNLINTLNGKVAGLTISTSSSGVGGSSKVILRGSKSGLGSNQALYVIDGVPMNNTLSNQPSSIYGGSNSYDGGDPISNLNPEDIENITVLKGASAAALYGSQGANGVILVTTKSGKSGHSSVSLYSGFNLSQAASLPKFQNNYAETKDSSTTSWGSKISNPVNRDNLKDFFQNGQLFTNAVSLSGGSEQAQTYFSYANVSGRGIEPGNNIARNNIDFKETGHFLNNKLTATADVNYMTQKIDNMPLSGYYFNPLTGLYLFPRSLDITQYKNTFEAPDPARNYLMTQNWLFNEDVQQNPWWITNRNTNSLNRNRILANASLKYDVNKWLNVQARGSIDRISDKYEQKIYAGTQQVLASANGSYNYSNNTTTQQYGDLLANFNFPGKKISVNGLVGTSIRDVKTDGDYFNSGKDGLFIPNVFTIQNVHTLDGAQSGTTQQKHSQWQSVFASANISFEEWIYLDLTARNDWASNLAFTPQMNYFYPSAGLNVILTQALHLPKAISFAKVRGSYAIVGNSPLAYQSNTPLAKLGTSGNIVVSTANPFIALKPEKTKSLELGTEWRFLENRLSFDVTYYKTNTTNQTLEIAAPQATLNNTVFINAGNIQNQGVEAMVRYDVFPKENKLQWNTGLNFATNQNKIISLSPQVDRFTLSGASGANYASQFKVGGSFGDIYGTVLQKDAQGRVLIQDGKPVKQGGDMVYLGNGNTKWQLGWNNNLSFGNFTFSFLIDGKFGGQVMSVTQAMLDGYGVSKATGDARDAGGVKVNGVDETGKAVTTVDAANWYSVVGGREGVSGEYMYSATTVRLREAALGYMIPLHNTFLKTLKFSVSGRNLIYFSKKAPFDPEQTMSTANGLGGVDAFMLPATRNYGLTLNATF
ncbi:SusC/RagA family TonB-linked outer membrane protein [Chitinophaga sp. Cy-1792]|uniref:SusC/RagA family TonB-linked outer membrane protein n=1 Tax=Chitinophaga sp. Cy-1792 TaxID=2608339 RepID=UPI001424394E|nr:SusC/RagA family TonB-linked outer membrane protein [Chitinophaga sp. Cy-1792]NIG55502.1 SusC/RagA family TonB-linked outer membrane protein [Chitinophaga sp. Cy-1792]